MYVVNTILKKYEDDIDMAIIIEHAVEFVEKNQKLNEYKESFINKDSEINRIFPKYYLKYVLNLLENIYITI